MGDWTIFQGVGKDGRWGISQGELGVDGSAKGIFLQVSAYEKQGRATIALLVTKFTGYRYAKSRTPRTN